MGRCYFDAWRGLKPLRHCAPAEGGPPLAISLPALPPDEGRPREGGAVATGPATVDSIVPAPPQSYGAEPLQWRAKIFMKLRNVLLPASTRQGHVAAWGAWWLANTGHG